MYTHIHTYTPRVLGGLPGTLCSVPGGPLVRVAKELRGTGAPKPPPQRDTDHGPPQDAPRVQHAELVGNRLRWADHG